MDDIIPLLIVIAIAVIGAASRKKKKRTFSENISAPQAESRKDDFLSWMERIADVDDEVSTPYKAQEVEIEEAVEDEKHVPLHYESLADGKEAYSNYSGFISPAEKNEMVEKEAQRVSSSEKNTQESSGAIKDSEIGTLKPDLNFDLQKAVIFSEILNRKYT